MQRESSKHSVKSLDFACAEDESHFRNSEGDDFIEDPWNWRSLTNSQIFLLKTGAIVGFGGFVFGYDIGVIAGALSPLRDKFSLSDIQAGLVVSLLPLGSLIGCCFGGPLCDKIGRWKTIQLQNVIFIFGALLISLAQNITDVYVGRIIIGIGSALSAVADIPYLTEVSPPCYRGRMSSAYEMLVVIGILISFLMDLIFRPIPGGWRYMFGIPAIFAFMQMCGMLLLPESPKWLLQNGKYDEAVAAIRQQYTNSTPTCQKPVLIDTVVEEYIAKRVNEYRKSNDTYQTHNETQIETLTRLFYEYKVPLASIMILMVFQQFTGGVVIRNYAPVIFENAGFGAKASLTFNLVLGIVKVFVTAWAIYRVDDIGRKPLLIGGIICIGSGMSILVLAFVFGVGRNIAVYLTACSLITMGYSFGFGPVCWLLQSEMFPIAIRGRCVGMSVFVSNIAQFFATFAFLPMISTFGGLATFMFFSVMCVLGLMYIVIFVVETKEKEPADINHDYNVSYDTGIEYLKGALCYCTLPQSGYNCPHHLFGLKSQTTDAASTHALSTNTSPLQSIQEDKPSIYNTGSN